MGIIDDLYRGGQPAGTGTPVEVPYESSFGYFNDVIGAGPPPASEGNTTAFDIYRNEGLVDEKGFLLSNPNVHMITAALYGGGPQKITNNQSLTPDFAAGANGKTVGGIGDTDGWGGDVTWDSPISGTAQEGQIFQTGAGDYLVKKNSWGQFVLEPMEGAIKGADAYFTNFTSGGHHLGVNPETGQVWYQQSTGTSTPYTNPNGAGQLQGQQSPVTRPADKAQGQQLSQTRPADKVSNGVAPQTKAVQQAVAQRARQEGMLSGDNPNWTELSSMGAQLSGGMGPFMLGQLAKRR
jgi:hypothetical protein